MVTPRGGSIALDRVRVTPVYQAIVIGGLMGHMTCVKFFFESGFGVFLRVSGSSCLAIPPL